MQEARERNQNLGSAYSFGELGEAERSAQQRPEQMGDNTKKQQEVLIEENAYLTRENTRLHREIKYLRSSFKNNPSSSPKNPQFSPRKLTPTTSITKLKTLPSISNSEAPLPSPSPSNLELNIEHIIRRDKLIAKLHTRIKIQEEVKKYQIEILEVGYQQKIKEKEEENEHLRSQIAALKGLSRKQTSETEKVDQDAEQIPDSEALQRQVANLISRVEALNVRNGELEEIICKLYYQTETYEKQSSAIENVMAHFSKAREQFCATVDKHHQLG